MNSAIPILIFFIGSTTGLAFPESRIINGSDVPLGKYPSMVSLQKDNMHECGGTILSENYIMTSAQCVENTNPESVSILAGTIDLTQGGTRHRAQQITIHEEYLKENYKINDIAVVRVAPPFVFGAATAPVVLPQQGQESVPGAVCSVVGWGFNAFGGSATIVDIQKEGSLFISTDLDCAYYHGGHVHPSHICAAVPNGGVGPCHYDIGDPLFLDGQQVGIVSWWTYGPCTIPPYPGVYTEVSWYVDWIVSKISSV